MLSFQSLKTKSRARESYSLSSKKLEVQKVGAYVVSVAESLSDLNRVDDSVFKVPSPKISSFFLFITLSFPHISFLFVFIFYNIIFLARE